MKHAGSYISLDKCKEIEARAKNLRNKVLIAFLWRHGLRVTEALMIKKKDISIDPDEKAISKFYVTTLKQKEKDKRGRKILPKRNVVYLNKNLQEPLELYIKDMQNDAYIFPSYGKTGHLTSRRVEQIVKKLADDAKIYQENGDPVHPHTFRHSLAMHLLKSGMNINQIQSILRHANLSSTGEYLKQDPKEVAEAYNRIMEGI